MQGSAGQHVQEYGWMKGVCLPASSGSPWDPTQDAKMEEEAIQRLQ